MIHTYVDLHRRRKSDYPINQYEIISSLFLKLCHNAGKHFFLHKYDNVSLSQHTNVPFYTFCDLGEGTGARPCTALRHHRDGSSSWDDSQRCPMGAVDISQWELTASELEEAQRGEEMKGRNEEEIALGPFCSPSSQSSRSGDVGTTSCCYQFPFVGFEFCGRMRTVRESKRNPRQKLCTHLRVTKSQPAPQLIAFYFY